ncbi:unnamed protein product [Musa acuminata subsp. burmannicoides]
MWESTILVMLQVMHLCWFIVRVSMIMTWHPCVALAFLATHFAFGKRTHPCTKDALAVLRSSKCSKSGVTMHGFALYKKNFRVKYMKRNVAPI